MSLLPEGSRDGVGALGGVRMVAGAAAEEEATSCKQVSLVVLCILSFQARVIPVTLTSLDFGWFGSILPILWIDPSPRPASRFGELVR